MKKNIKGFSGVLVTLIIALLASSSAYIYFQNKSTKNVNEIEIQQSDLIDSQKQDSPESILTNTKRGGYVEVNNNTGLKKNDLRKEEYITYITEDGTNEKNIIHPDTDRKVTVTGKNIIACLETAIQCEFNVMIGDRAFKLKIPSDATSNTSSYFIPSDLKSGVYSLYILNYASGVKSNTIQIEVKNSNK